VIGGILLLAYELRQNNDLMAAEARFNRLAIVIEGNDKISDNAELAELVLKDASNEELTPLEQIRMGALAMRVLLTREWSFQEVPRSELPIARWRRSTQNSPAIRASYWLNKDSFDPEFAEWFAENILNEIPNE
jgi:hypothetical protein